MAKKSEKDEEREYRISNEIIVDAYDDEERAAGWYYYLEETLHFPFLTTCIAYRAISPLRVKDEVEAIDLAPYEECEHEIFVMMRWDREEGLGVPLSQLKVVHGDEDTRQAVEDWNYWIRQGYRY
ncbi:MAG: calcium-binding protein [bacterium]|nr:calcium-binding protein [bacterium]